MSLFGLVRHGQTDWNFANLYQGASNIPLNSTGVEQAHRALDTLPDFSWDLVVSSTLSRAEQTARIIAHDHGIEFGGAFEGLREVNFGWAEGRPIAEVLAAYPGRDFPERESIDSVIERATRTLDELADTHPNKAILVVAHGTLIRYLMSSVARRPFPSFPNASLSVLEVSQSAWRVPYIAGRTLAEPWIWERRNFEIPSIDSAWDVPGGEPIDSLASAPVSFFDTL